MLQVIWRIRINPFGYFPDGIPIYGFGMMLFLAFLICTWMAGRRAVREGIPRETIQDLAIWLFVGGLLGARITYLLQEKPSLSFKEMLFRLPKIWDGGIILYGAVLGGLVSYVVAYFLIYRRRGLSTWKLADVIAPAFAVGLCLGRLGCFLNGCCYGQVACADCAVYPVSFPLSAPPRDPLVEAGYQTVAGFTLAMPQPFDANGVQVGEVAPDSPAYRGGLRPGDLITEVNDQPTRNVKELNDLLGYVGNWPRGRSDVTLTFRKAASKADSEPTTATFSPRTLGLYPTQLYEVISMFLLFLVLTAYFPLRRQPGQVMAVLMMGYAAHRYLNEILRDDPRPEGFEKYTSVLLFIAGLMMWVWLQNKPRAVIAPAAAAPMPA
jgi:prolipoprotein diacylglyceryltransferase